MSVNETDPTPTIDDATATIVVTSTDLITEKTVNNPTPDEGGTIIYTLTVTNASGTDPATGVNLEDILPDGGYLCER